jgi:virginiamycin B lyase
VTQFRVPGPSGLGLTDIAPGSDGNLWFTIDSAGLIGRISPQGIITRFLASAEIGIIGGPDGNLWFGTEDAYIGRITPSGVATYFSIPRDEVFTESIVTGPDGNLWCTEYAPGLIRMQPNGSFVRIRIPRPATDIAVGPDGNLWFAMMGTDDPNAPIHASIGSMPPDASGIRQFIIFGWWTSGITAGPDQSLWFVLPYSRGIVGRITTQGALTLVELPSVDSFPFEIALGSDGNLWITQQGPRSIARVTPDFITTEFRLLPVISLGGVVRNPSLLLLSDQGILRQLSMRRRRLASERIEQKRYSQLVEAVNRSADFHPPVTEMAVTNLAGNLRPANKGAPHILSRY